MYIYFFMEQDWSPYQTPYLVPSLLIKHINGALGPPSNLGWTLVTREDLTIQSHKKTACGIE
jgi:hypothetical protein